MSESWSNHHSDSWVSGLPSSGIGVGGSLAFVVGVKIDSGSFEPSTRHSGSSTPGRRTVLLLLLDLETGQVHTT
jgi:hypothetical protein